MKTKSNRKTYAFLMAGILFLTLSISGCSKSNETVDPALNSTQIKAADLNYSLPEMMSPFCSSCIDSLPYEDLSTAEIESLIFMREEELLAHDVYLTFSGLYTKPIFRNITRSEQVHTNAVKALITKYGLVDPAANHEVGIFVNQDLQALYTALVAQGSQSLLNGLIVGATIEELDINDLQNHLLETDNQDITCVFNNLIRGSQNHLRAFQANLRLYKYTYTPQYLPQAEFDAIVNTGQ